MMYQDSYARARLSLSPRKKPKRRKFPLLFLAFLLIAVLTIGGSLAYLLTQTKGLVNTFTPSQVSCKVTEDFDGTTKKNVNVTNTGDTEAYIRVKLVSYRVNEGGQHIGGLAPIPTFTPGGNWVNHGEYYYYTLPVAPGKMPANPLIDDTGIKLASYNDADGGKQVIEVMAEAIQSGPVKAVGESWGVSIAENSVTPYVVSGGE